MRSAIVTVALAGLAVGDAARTETQKPGKRASLPTVSVSGNAFYANGERFYIRGIAYQPGGSSGLGATDFKRGLDSRAAKSNDPLADEDICKRDIPFMKELGVNAIRVYMIDNNKNHDVCMNLLAENGIYLIADLNNPKYSINRANPGPSYNAEYLQSLFATVELLAKYDNTLAFYSGNEVINDEVKSTLSAPYVKAVTRDVRQYIKNRKLRKIPVGYSAADVSQNRQEQAEYFNCGTDDERSDFFAFNDYSWCNSDFKTSGWDQKVKNFTDYGLPIFLSEWGCLADGHGRKFGEVQALMSEQMTGVYSGGLLYELPLEPNKFGILDLSGSEPKKLDDFDRFKSALAANPAPAGAGGAAPTGHAVDCPKTNEHWLVDSPLLPAIPEEAKEYMIKGAGPGPGLNGKGSQNGKGQSTGTATAGSGAATGTASTGSSGSKDNAASRQAPAMEFAPMMLTGLVTAFTLAGAMLM